MNAAVGLGALQSNTTGYANTAFGAGALNSHQLSNSGFGLIPKNI